MSNRSYPGTPDSEWQIRVGFRTDSNGNMAMALDTKGFEGHEDQIPAFLSAATATYLSYLEQEQ